MDGRTSINRPHPFGKGRGGYSSSLASEGAMAVSIEPTSLERGEGLVGGSTCDVGSGEGEGEGGGGEGGGRGRGENERNINCDGVDVEFKLRSLAMITFDIGT
jgi:hypothetical protein